MSQDIPLTSGTINGSDSDDRSVQTDELGMSIGSDEREEIIDNIQSLRQASMDSFTKLQGAPLLSQQTGRDEAKRKFMAVAEPNIHTEVK